MRLGKVLRGLLILALSLLGFNGAGAITPSLVIPGAGIFASFSEGQLYYPFEPLVELIVCPEGPPTCQFRRI